jgi:hypothetical protein
MWKETFYPYIARPCELRNLNLDASLRHLTPDCIFSSHILDVTFHIRPDRQITHSISDSWTKDVYAFNIISLCTTHFKLKYFRRVNTKIGLYATFFTQLFASSFYDPSQFNSLYQSSFITFSVSFFWQLFLSCNCVVTYTPLLGNDHKISIYITVIAK